MTDEHVVVRVSDHYYVCEKCGQAGSERWAIIHQFRTFVDDLGRRWEWCGGEEGTWAWRVTSATSGPVTINPPCSYCGQPSVGWFWSRDQGTVAWCRDAAGIPSCERFQGDSLMSDTVE